MIKIGMDVKSIATIDSYNTAGSVVSYADMGNVVRVTKVEQKWGVCFVSFNFNGEEIRNINGYFVSTHIKDE